MGIEIIYPIGAGLGVVVLIWLVIRSFMPRSRPFALPTLLAALLVAFFERDRVSPDFYWMALLDVFFLGAVAFGLHAHAIQWLVGRRRPSEPPPNNRWRGP